MKERWSDDRNGSLEKRLGAIVLTLECAAQVRKGQRVEEKEQERQRIEDERQWRIAQRRREELQERVQRLKEQVSQWSESQVMRAYIAAARTELTDQISQDSALEQWFIWCEGYAEQVDPLGKLKAQTEGSKGVPQAP